MNKILLSIRYLLLIFLTYLTICYVRVFGINGFTFFIYLLLFGIIVLFSIIDFFKKRFINSTYNILSVFVYFVLVFIFMRVVFNGGILPFIYSNHDYYVDMNVMYMSQNYIYIIILLSLLIIYRYINIDRKESKYHPVSVVCFLLSVVSIVPTIECFDGGCSNVFYYLIFNIILLGIEIYRLVRDNHIKREWFIFISFLFNMFAFISIFVSFFK